MSDISITFNTHLIRQVTHNDKGEPLARSPELGVFTLNNYEPEAVLGEYVGHVHSGEEKNEYTCDEWQALKYRNEIALTNDGCPNAQLVRVSNINGLTFRIFLIALTRIPKGHQICWDYGPSHLLKIQKPYLELRGHALREFVNNCDFNELAKLNGASFETHISSTAFIISYYIINTPSVLFTMILDQSVRPERLKSLIHAIFQVMPKNPTVLATFQQRLQFIDGAINAVRFKQKLTPSLAEALEKEIQSIFKERSLEYIATFFLDHLPELAQKIKRGEYKCVDG